MLISNSDSASFNEFMYTLHPESSGKNLNVNNQAIAQTEINQKINKLWADFSQQKTTNINHPAPNTDHQYV